MKKILLTISAVCFSAVMMAGGLVTNTNQSAAWTRLQARNASLGVDAVYYNPAGTVFSEPGIHFSVSNQTITQTRWINTNYPILNGVEGDETREFVGDVFAPVFPSIYGVFNTGKFAISAAFNPIGGGGGATFSEGLPRLEYDPALIASSLALGGAPVTGYELEANFEASSIYFGYQVNVAYKINDMLSVAVGGRLVTAKNTYNGYLRNVNMNFGGAMTPVADVFSTLAGQATAGATSATGAATQVQGIITAGFGGLTLPELVTATVLTQPEADALADGLIALGGDPTGLTATQLEAAFTGAAATLTTTAAELTGQGQVYGALMNQEADVLQTATGFAPIFSVNFRPIESLNIAVRYEGKTSLKFVNETTSDFITAVDATGTPTASMFEDELEFNADMPAMLAVGVNFRPINKLALSAGATTYFDNGIDYSQGLDIDLIEKNYLSYSFGAEYGLSDALAISAGYSGTRTGVNDLYQSDMTHSLNTSTIGGGFRYSIGSLVDIDLGAAFTSYAEESYDKVKQIPTGGSINYIETYDRGVWIIAVGANFHF